MTGLDLSKPLIILFVMLFFGLLAAGFGYLLERGHWGGTKR